MEQVLAATGQVDFVVNAAAVLPRGDLVDTTEETVYNVTEVNYLAPVQIAQEFFPHLKRTRGSMLNFTSSSYTRGRRGYSLYSSTKAAVVNLTQALADEWSDDGVRVNVVNPERTGTPMRTRAFGQEPPGTLLDSEEVARRSLDVLVSGETGMVDRHPQGRPAVNPPRPHGDEPPTGRRGGRGGRPLASYRRRRQRPVLSVVMPVHNVAEYLPAALDSALSQTFKELEVIAVDDGSTDACPEILRDYARRDYRVRVLRQDNAGQGIARNVGVQHARGEFLTFLDSDDVVPLDAYAAMVEGLRASGSDFSVGNLRRLRHGELQRMIWSRTVHRQDRIGTTIEEFPAAMQDIIACNRMFRTAFWRDRVGDFQGGIAYEDHVPMLTAYVRARKLRRAAAGHLPLADPRGPHLHRPAEGPHRQPARPDRGEGGGPAAAPGGGVGGGVRRVGGSRPGGRLPAVPAVRAHRRRGVPLVAGADVPDLPGPRHAGGAGARPGRDARARPPGRPGALGRPLRGRRLAAPGPEHAAHHRRRRPAGRRVPGLVLAGPTRCRPTSAGWPRSSATSRLRWSTSSGRRTS